VFSVPEDRVAEMRARVGEAGAVQVRAWGDGSRTLPATVREVAAAADPSTRTFLVKADIGQAPMRLGQTASAIVETPKVAGVVKLPLPAVMEREGQSTVWVVDKATMTVQPRAVRVAGAEGNGLIVSDGLQPGQVVVTAGVHVLTPGLKVKFYEEPAAVAAAAGR
jgi:RND family efflux transporter MFP subunit